MAPERRLAEANGFPTANQTKPPPTTRIVPVIPLRLTKNVHENAPQGASLATGSGLMTPVQSEVSETTPQAATLEESSVSTPPSAPVTPDSSLTAEKSVHADILADSPLLETNGMYLHVSPKQG
jgi:hypothetical protein